MSGLYWIKYDGVNLLTLFFTPAFPLLLKHCHILLCVLDSNQGSFLYLLIASELYWSFSWAFSAHSTHTHTVNILKVDFTDSDQLLWSRKLSLSHFTINQLISGVTSQFVKPATGPGLWCLDYNYNLAVVCLCQWLKLQFTCLSVQTHVLINSSISPSGGMRRRGWGPTDRLVTSTVMPSNKQGSQAPLFELNI